MSLRDDLIEAGARHLVGDGYFPEDFHRDTAGYVLDAMLDLLTERADEWRGQTPPNETGSPSTADIADLLAVLRNPGSAG